MARPPPEDRPVLPHAPSRSQASVHTDRVNIWKDVKDNFIGEQTLLEQAKILLCNAVPEYCLSAIKDDVHAFHNVTILQIRQHLDLQFLVLPPSEITANLLLLEVPYSISDSLAEYIGSHREIAAILAANNCGVADSRRFLYLLHGVTPCGIFDSRILHYINDHATIILQTFNTFATAILEFDRNRGRITTAKAAGYVAAVSPVIPVSRVAAAVHPDPVVAAIISSLNTANAAIAGIQSILQSQQNPRGGGFRKIAGGGVQGGGGHAMPLYCWTHGAMNHPSRSCTHKKVGHQDAATYANQMKGKKA